MYEIKEIGAFEAKTHLSALLRETERGQSFVILRRGKPVARLLPPEFPDQAFDKEALLEGFRKIRERVARDGPVNVRELIEEGRRF